MTGGVGGPFAVIKNFLFMLTPDTRHAEIRIVL